MLWAKIREDSTAEALNVRRIQQQVILGKRYYTLVPFTSIGREDLIVVLEDERVAPRFLRYPEWVHVLLDDGRTGYCAGWLLEFTEYPEPVDPPTLRPGIVGVNIDKTAGYQGYVVNANVPSVRINGNNVPETEFIVTALLNNPNLEAVIHLNRVVDVGRLNTSQAPYAAAETWLAQLQASWVFQSVKAMGRLGSVFFESANESLQYREWLHQFYRALIPLAKRQEPDLRLATYFFANGHPTDTGEFAGFMDVLNLIYENGHVLGFNEYSGLSLFDGGPYDAERWGYFFGRHRLVHRDVLIPNGMGDMPIWIGEWNFNYIQQVPGSAPGGDNVITKDQWLATVREIEAELHRTPDVNVRGLTVFVEESYGEEWRPFYPPQPQFMQLLSEHNGGNL